MRIITKPLAMQRLAYVLRRQGKSIGFVPTMGALHEGHLALIRRSAKENDITVVSVFVNPTQFGPTEDYARYPRPFRRDCRLAQAAGADIIFHPTPSDIYPPGYQTFVDPGPIGQILEGAARPGHMRGVATICTKLFNIVKPHRAYFGQKDAQQLAVIKRMVHDLNLDLKIVGCPIVRNSLGVALSSRHAYLTDDDLKKAAVIHQALQLAEKLVAAGYRRAGTIRARMKKMLDAAGDLQTDYIAFNRWDDLEELDVLSGKVLVSLAVKIKGVRLIDNVIVDVRGKKRH